MKRRNLIGHTFGRLTVLSEAHQRRTPSGKTKRYVQAQCTCGQVTTVGAAKLTTGHTKSCGCLLDETLRQKHVLNRVADHPLWKIYQGMRTRCENPNSTFFRYYGGRGIAVCERWKESFWNFVADIGERPSLNYTVDRRNNDGNYDPLNCRWATRSEQALNRRAKGAA